LYEGLKKEGEAVLDSLPSIKCCKNPNRILPDLRGGDELEEDEDDYY